MKLEFSRHIFEKIIGYQISLKSKQWEPSCSLRTDGQTEVTTLIATFRLKNCFSACRIWSSKIGVWENSGLRQCDLVWLVEWFPPASSPRIKQSNKHFKHQAFREELFLDSWTLEDESSTNLRNVRNSTCNYTGSYCRVPEFCSMSISTTTR